MIENYEGNKKIILKEIYDNHNTVVITCANKLLLLVGMAETGEDYYYIFKDWKGSLLYSICLIKSDHFVIFYFNDTLF